MVIQDNLQVVDAGLFQNMKQVFVEFLPVALVALPIERDPDRADPGLPEDLHGILNIKERWVFVWPVLIVGCLSCTKIYADGVWRLPRLLVVVLYIIGRNDCWLDQCEIPESNHVIRSRRTLLLKS